MFDYPDRPINQLGRDDLLQLAHDAYANLDPQGRADHLANVLAFNAGQWRERDRVFVTTNGSMRVTTVVEYL